MNQVLIAAPDKGEIVSQIAPAVQAAGAVVAGYVIGVEGLLEKAAALRPDLVLLRVDLARRGDEIALIEMLPDVAVAVALPRGRADLRERLAALPNVRGVAIAPDYGALLAAALGTLPSAASAFSPSVDPRLPAAPEATLRPGVQTRVETPPPAALSSSPASAPVWPISPTSAPSNSLTYPAVPAVTSARPLAPLPPALRLPARPPTARKRGHCLCFAGVKGGVGTTTALCALAAAAAGLQMHACVVDLTGTGDVRATLPATRPGTILYDMGKDEFVSNWPRLRGEFDLTLIDGGRLPFPALPSVSALLICVTRADTTDRLPSGLGRVVVVQAVRAPVGLKAEAVLPVQDDLYDQLAQGCFLQPGPLLHAATLWAKKWQREASPCLSS